ncbi:4'-phosphopantetheinyl transferase superfamily protein [Nocardiopsis sp. NRRL B-16309]|uniref:4'-phosphopantetheinyl transferase family protein n=1 Tax=Nocardiopsis sp. NRRL B-16309 TaxID=1519494 RepID=UPI0006AE51DE|nr:4'-phosphopantetheinyl transferase superfamily protein [Nocardiopsis sp. NRRL B-16309]KOX10055.1 4-phosphopantetheinyl transferase [Nocardiopsis sp. NRRL B-16309]
MTVDSTPLAPTVWWARTSDADSRLLRLLDEGEQARNARFRQQADRDRHLLGRSLARLALADLAGCPPEKVTFDLRCRSCEDKARTGARGGDEEPHGKPHPSGPAQGWEVSVSHSGDWVALAVSEGVPVGIDVEGVTAARDVEGLADYTLAEEERRAWLLLPAQERATAFFGYWARKEALLKATGLGLSGGLRRVAVSPPHTPARLLSWEGGGGPDAAWLSDLDRGTAYRSALAVLTDRPVELVVRTPRETAALLGS